MLHTIGFSGQPASASLTNIAGLADQTMTVNGNNITITAPVNNLVAAYGRGAHMTRAQIFTPSLNRLYPYEIAPVDVSATPQQPNRFAFFPESPIGLQDEEFMQAIVIDATAAEQADVFAWLSDGPIAPISSGEIFTARATGTTTLTAATWTNVAITFTSTLPSGNYQCVGLRAQSTGLVAARMVFPGYEWRPGVIGCTATSDLGYPTVFRFGHLGEFGRFKNTVPPTIDCYSLSADTSETFHLDLIYLGR